MTQPALFYPLATLAVASALAVVLARHPVYAVLSLVTTLFCLSGLFALLGAYFVAVIQVLIYAGAILVLFLFVVMLLDMAPEKLLTLSRGTLRLAATAFGLFFLWELSKAARGLGGYPPAASSPLTGTTAAVGKLLFTTYALPFEVASVLLIVGIVGAVVLAREKAP